MKQFIKLEDKKVIPMVSLRNALGRMIHDKAFAKLPKIEKLMRMVCYRETFFNREFYIMTFDKELRN